MSEERGRLTLVATPIGNLADLSARASKTLADADLWLVEDTRVSAKLLQHLGIKKPMRVLNEHTREDQIAKYVEEIEREGLQAVVVTDGGAPGISDPGAICADLCYEQGLAVDAIPGPSAVVNALMLSGFFAQRFAFLGFLGRKPGDIRKELLPYADSAFTLVLFESPYRVLKTLEIASEVLGDRRIAVCREMTKIYQEVRRLRLSELAELESLNQKGEFSIVIEGKRKGK